ncbi:hypothetical protein FPHYL_10580 [Fusarium phyllophilum]|uniref:CCHC-type domain-containing protein n=1 Tax=Fusarium phyllophilum TaxID=47803 RepID=A0A8H5J0Z7_9HYPO|nr:hypothetical protein FPHYL_10580 [Fusarium phyllophilum]
MTLLIRPDNAEESKSGNSVSNSANANANFAVQLVVQLYRDAAPVDAHDFSKRASVLILTAYKEQKRLHNLLLQQLTEAEVPKDLVEVRNVNDSPSHEADVIILDLVRTLKGDFIKEAPRMNVGMARARIGQFVIDPGKKTPLEWPLKHLVAFLEERSAAIHLRDRCRWYLMCQNCCQPGHLATDCKFKPKCARCDGASHATRNCPRAEEDAISTSASEPITADDGIHTTREEAFAWPDKHKDAMRKAYCNAMRGLRKVKKDQDVNDVGTNGLGPVVDDGPDDGSPDEEAPDEEAGDDEAGKGTGGTIFCV